MGAGIATDRALYEAVPVPDSRVYSFTIVATIANPLNRILHVQRCGPDAPTPQWFVRLVDTAEGQSSGYTPVWQCVAHDNPFVVPPGRTRTDSIRITGPNGEGVDGKPLGLLEGTFQLSYIVSVCNRDGDCEAAPDSLKVSNTFQIVIEE